MKTIYFKQHFESCEHERTVYGRYNEDNITPEGDIRCKVFSIELDHENKIVKMEVCEEYFEKNEITPVSIGEYVTVCKTLEKAQEYYIKAEDVLRSLI